MHIFFELFKMIIFVNDIMMNQKIAIPTCEGMLWPHFGKAPQVTIVTVEDGQVKESVTLEAPEHEHGAMPRFIAAQGCTDVLCGGHHHGHEC